MVCAVNPAPALEVVNQRVGYQKAWKLSVVPVIKSAPSPLSPVFSIVSVAELSISGS